MVSPSCGGRTGAGIPDFSIWLSCCWGCMTRVSDAMAGVAKSGGNVQKADWAGSGFGAWSAREGHSPSAGPALREHHATSPC